MGKKMRQTSQTRPDIPTAFSKATFTIKSPNKPIVILRRRLRGALNRIHHLKNKNTELLSRNSELLHTIQAQKMEIAAVQKDNRKFQRLYLDGCFKNNSLQVKLKKLSESMADCVTEIDLCLPSLVTISDLTVRNKASISIMRSSNLSPERNYTLSTIQEESDDEVINLHNISQRPRRSRLGMAARIWLKENAERRKNEKERLGPLYSSDSSESEINHSNFSRSHLEPVVRDASQNPPFIEVDSEMNSVGETGSQRTPRMTAPLNSDNPLEGCSWMYQDEQSLRYFKNKNSEKHVSDSSNDENGRLQSRIRLHSIKPPFSASNNKCPASSTNNLLSSVYTEPIEIPTATTAGLDVSEPRRSSRPKRTISYKETVVRKNKKRS